MKYQYCNKTLTIDDLCLIINLENKPPVTWPSEGTIQFDKVSLRYSKEDEPVLNKISFTIRGKEKAKHYLIFIAYRER